MTPLRRRAFMCAVAGLVSVMAVTAQAPPAKGNVYWANTSGNSIGRVDAGGRTPDQSFITGASAPRGVAVDGSHIYWAHSAGSGAIGRSNLNGTSADQLFISTGGKPQGVATDNAGVYWTYTASGAGMIGRAPLSGSPVKSSFVPTGPTPCGIAVDADKVYWANGGNPGSIGRSHGAFTPTQAFIAATHDPCGVAVTNRYVYWTNRATNSIGRAQLDGTGADENFLPGVAPCGVAVDGSHIYWSNANDTIGRAKLDGSGIDQGFVTGAQGPCGVAVDPTVSATPAAHRYSRTAIGRDSTIKAFVLENTSSSTLGVSSITLIGKNRADFVKTGDSCITNATPAGSACIFNVRFAPRAPGLRRAQLRVTSTASNTPTLIPLTGLGVDRTPPRITEIAIRPRAFPVTRSGDLAGPRRTTGASLEYALTEPARVVYSIQALRRGRLIGGKCRAATHADRADTHCQRWAELGQLARSGHAGLNYTHFTGHLGGKALRPGRYRALLAAADAAGNASRARVVGFRVVP